MRSSYKGTWGPGLCAWGTTSVSRLHSGTPGHPTVRRASGRASVYFPRGQSSHFFEGVHFTVSVGCVCVCWVSKGVLCVLCVSVRCSVDSLVCPFPQFLWVSLLLPDFEAHLIPEAVGLCRRGIRPTSAFTFGLAGLAEQNSFHLYEAR